MKPKIVIIGITFFLLISGCDLFNNGEPQGGIKLSEKAAQLIEADNKFGLELFQKVVAYEDEAENVMVSPLSVSLALAMTYNGANGETKTAMEETLKLNGLTTDEINQSYESLVNALKSLDEKVLLEIANAIFYREGLEVLDDFISVNQDYYDAEVSPLDFNDPGAVDVINGWVADNTNDKIKTIINHISGDQALFLLNAIYFKGIWTTEFDPEHTGSFPFYKEDGSEKMVQMMCHTETHDYYSNEIFQAARLSYGIGNYNMCVFLPGEGKSASDIIALLNQENWEAWIDGFQETENVDIRMPKFNFEYEIKLNDVLSDMGMAIAFGAGADFTGINPAGDLYIEYVKHKTFVDVNEEGTEAAAVTVVSMLNSAVDPQNVVPFYVNKPFLFTITEKDTGAILFIGEVKNPEYN